MTDIQKPRTLWNSFIPRIAVFFVLPLILLLLALILYSQSLHHNAMLELVGDRNLRAVKSAASAVQNEFIRYQQDLIRFARTGQDTLFLDAFDLGYADYNCQERKINGQNSTRSSDVLQQISASLCAILKDQPKDSIAYQLDNSVNRKAIWLGIQLDGNNIIVAGLNLDPFFARVLGATFQSDNLVVQVFDSDHQLIYQTGTANPGEHDLYHPSILEALQGGEGVIYPSTTMHPDSHGSHVIAYAPIQPVEWVLATDEAWSDVSTSSLELTQSLPLILIPLLLAALAGLYAGYRQIILPLTRLQEKAKNLGNGDRQALDEPVGGIQEIASLQTELRQSAEKMEQARADLQEYLGAMTMGIEAERKQIALDLHDEPLQDTIALKQALQSGSTQKNKQLADEAQSVIEKLRRVIRGLRPPYLEDIGLVPALEMLTKEYDSRINISVKTLGDVVRLSAEQEMALYRIAQHAVANSVRYSNGTKIEISLEFVSGVARLSIRDDGVGFDLPQNLGELSRHGHYGILGMKERAEMVGGRFTIVSIHQQGMKIEVEIPLP